MVAKLVIDGIEVGFDQSLPISTNMSVADIREPEKRQTTFTKTIAVPGTKQVNSIFEYIYDVNSDLQVFNPNKEIPAYYELNNVRVFEGKLKLADIVKRYNGTVLELTYNCVIIATSGNLFIDISTKFLTDLDFSDLDHTLNYTNFSATPVPGTGYCYGYIDYGVAGLNGYNWDVEAMKAAIWEKEYVDRIFSAAGKTYTSNFFNSAYYKKIAIPDIYAGPYQLTETQKQNAEFYAGRTTGVTVNVPGSYSTGWAYGTIGQIIQQPAQLNNDTTAPFNDPGGLYNTGTYLFTTGINGWYNIVFEANFTLNFNLPATGVTLAGNQLIALAIEVSTNGGATWNIAAFNTFNIFIIPAGTPTINTVRTIQVPGQYYASGTLFRCSVRNNGQSDWVVYNASNVPVTTGTSSMDFVLNAGSKFYSVMSQTSLSFGNTVEMNSTVPDNIKQLDFLTSILKAHNLYVEQDKNNENNYIIEPREDFINYSVAASVDWTRKQDLSQPISIHPMNELDAKKYSWSYKSDKDYFNGLYENTFKEVYGYKKIDVDTDFPTGEKKVELIFSPTPGASFQTNIVAPRFLTIEGAYPGSGQPGSVKPLKCNIRRLYWGGMKNCDQHNLRVSAGGFTPTGTNYIHPIQYPSLNHFDDSAAPTVDLCFNAPRQLYFITPAQSWTTNNLFNAFWSTFITEITDPNSKLIKTAIVLDERDIYKFSFRNLVFIENAYYFVNKIEDYDPQERKTCRVELLKLKKGPVFSPAVYNPGLPPAGQNRTISVNPAFNNTGNSGQTGTFSIGQNLINQGTIGLLTGSNTIVDGLVEGFDGIGINGLQVGSELSNKTMIRNRALVAGDDGLTELKTYSESHDHDFNVHSGCFKYYVDCTSNNIAVRLLDVSNYKGEIQIIRVDSSAHSLIVEGLTGTELIRTDGVSSTSDSVPGYATRRYISNSSAWYY